jgi:L-fucose isomerase-like protein
VKLEEIAGYGRIPSYIKPEKVVRQAKWTLAVDRWIEENECDASAIQCWRSLQDNFGCATCLTMSMMGEKLTPSACEVDVMGAVSMYALALAAEAPSAILDWNNNYGREVDKCVCTHCGNYPKSFIGETPEVSELDVLGSVLGKENCFGAVKGKVQPGPMTFSRASTDDRLGTIKAYVGRGRVHRRSVRHGRRHRGDESSTAWPAAWVHRAKRIRAPRRNGSRSSCRSGERSRHPILKLADLPARSRARV